MEMASKNLTPVALELGGETGNWCIVRKDANLKDAARKIAFFKIMNAGQVCININQVAVAEEVAEQFIEELKQAIKAKIKAKEGSLVGNMASQGTTPRQLTDLIGSLCDLTSGSGDKGTPVVLVQNYFVNYSQDE